jgi:nitrogen fixation protein NifB
MKVALATKDGEYVTQHFGRSPSFHIYEIDDTTYDWEFVEVRENAPACGEGHNSSAFAESIALISDCSAIFVAQIGGHAAAEVSRAGITILDKAGLVDELIEGYIAYIKKTKARYALRDEKRREVQLAQEPQELPKAKTEIDEKILAEHPCFAESAKGRYGRLHLPVSPVCNIRCGFCIRSCNDFEDRPGVAAGILPSSEAVRTVERALEISPNVRVVGIAGPGDTLATNDALDAFQRVHEAYPDLIECLSTNGLNLPGKSPALKNAGVLTLTVTVNAVDPNITAQIVDGIVFEGKSYTGLAAAEILISRQLRGIREAVDAGITVKVNSVLIPGVNADHIADIAKTVAEAGASRHNIIPLIPQHKFADTPAPTCVDVEKARAAAGKYINQFLHCAHCRADACGIPGETDFSSQLYSTAVMETFSHG